MGRFIPRYSIPFSLMNNMKKQKDMTLKEELPNSDVFQYATREEWEIPPKIMKKLSQSKNDT